MGGSGGAGGLEVAVTVVSRLTASQLPAHKQPGSLPTNTWERQTEGGGVVGRRVGGHRERGFGGRER